MTYYLHIVSDYLSGLPWWVEVSLGITVVCFGIQLYLYAISFTRMLRYQRKIRKGKVSFLPTLPPVSVVICARNEDYNLQEFLPKVLTQDYPEYEVVVVDDRSEDETSDLLNRMKQQYPRLRSTFVPQGAKLMDSKKFALTLGIKSAQHDLLLFTDADCYPRDRQWIRRMVRNFTDGTQIVLGYGAYDRKPGLLNWLIGYDTLFIALQYLNFSLGGRTYMGVGRNMAYRKSMFQASKGFTSHLNLQSGDDDLFINEVANKHNTRVEISPESVTQSNPKPTWKLWTRQKERHLSAGRYYRIGSQVLLGTEIGSRTLFYAGLITLCSMGDPILWVGAGCLFLLRFLVQTYTMNRTASLLRERHYYVGLLLLDIVLPLIHFLLYLKVLSSKRSKYKWK